MSSQKVVVAVAFGLWSSLRVCADVQVRDSRLALHERSGLTVAVGEVTLPSAGFWRVVESTTEGNALSQIAVVPPRPDRAPSSTGTPAASPTEVSYKAYALASDRGEVRFQVVNQPTGERLACTWSLAQVGDAPAATIKEWAQFRGWSWGAWARRADAPILRSWLASQESLFGVRSDVAPPGGGRRQRDPERETDLFGVLGGQAALRETLQLQALQLGETKSAGAADVPVAEIPGVEVKSHPYEELLGSEPGGQLRIADVVPTGRFFVYAAKPAAVLPLLNDGAGFVARLGATATGRALDHGVIARYLDEFGMSRPWIETVLRSGTVSELAVFMPDLFVIDGTEVTLVCRVPNLALLQPLLAGIGVRDLAAGKPVAVDTARGTRAYWAVTGDLLLVGTSEAELATALALVANPQGSLGRSAEFRYMLTQLPLTPETRLFAYFSDPFIRRLVGPEVKLGQLRRIAAKARLQTVTAAALLYKFDGHGGEVSVAALQGKGYLPQDMELSDITLDPRLVARSKTYGTLADLASISAVPVKTVTAAEAQAYQGYLENYTRFWRQFFDPIALRMDDTAGGGLEITTFILPLLDNSIYDHYKEVLATERDGIPLRIPNVDPPPVALLSLKLPAEVWREVAAGVQHDRRAPADAALQRALADLGPSVHFGIHDSNPILAFGSGELLGLGGSFGGSGDEMASIALLLSALTRPCTLFVELRQGDATKEFLRSGGLARLLAGAGDWVQLNQYKLTGEDAWICSFQFADVSLNLRLRIEVRNQYLLIHNLPWSAKITVAASEATAMDGIELTLNPAAATHQFAALFTAASERERAVAMEGLAYLYPLVLAGETAASAAARHRELFGFTPVHPVGGAWSMEDGRLVSSLYGAPGTEQQPAYVEGETRFGVLRGVTRLRAGMQFEKTGLRARVRWTFAP